MDRKAFTLIELLVVIAIIAILMGILMPTLRAVKEQARQQACASRIRQQVLASTLYAQDNRSTLALPSTRGNWLHDVAINTVNFMLKSGMTREMFYCPSNEIDQKHTEYFWEFTTKWDGTRFINVTDDSFIISGYNYLLQSARGDRPPIKNNENKTGPKRWCKTLNEKQASIMELCIDAVPGQKRTGAKYGYTFGEVTGGGIWTQYHLFEKTNHLKTDAEPLGSNVGFLDGHVQWRRFQDMESRYGDTTEYWW
jgi:prepilin-type N-terminal cleavage/methylation domain-containing protein/prepilin-type processing-associated H-X9-DG protein